MDCGQFMESDTLFRQFLFDAAIRLLAEAIPLQATRRTTPTTTPNTVALST